MHSGGVRLMLRSQHNAWIHAVASCCVLIVGGLCVLSGAEWCWIILAIMAVWTAEALNTALEFLADVASPDFHPLVEKAKDVAAGGGPHLGVWVGSHWDSGLGPTYPRALARPSAVGSRQESGGRLCRLWGRMEGAFLICKPGRTECEVGSIQARRAARGVECFTWNIYGRRPLFVEAVYKPKAVRALECHYPTSLECLCNASF